MAEWSRWRWARESQDMRGCGSVEQGASGAWEGVMGVWAEVEQCRQ